MNLRITPRRLSGTVTPPGSKSMAHRLLIAAALASGVSVVESAAQGAASPQNALISQDIEATLRCLAALGAAWEVRGNAYHVTGIRARRAFGLSERVTAQDFHAAQVSGNSSEDATVPDFHAAQVPGNSSEQATAQDFRAAQAPGNLSDYVLPRFDCGESGSTLRFLIPIALAVTGGGVFTGYGRLMERPQGPYESLFDQKGIFHARKGNSLTVRGTLTPGRYRLPGDVSSQFFTGLLFALPLLDGESVLESVTPLQSAPYVRMTLDALSGAGIRVDADADGQRFTVRPQPYRAFRAAVESDWSQAAFWYAANFLGADVNLKGLNPRSAQGDRIIETLSERMRRDGEIRIDLSDCPDLLPPLAVMSAARHGSTRFVNAGRLRMKESDRLSTVARMLRALGVEAEEGPDFLNVPGGTLRGGTVDGCNDHRIVMAAAVAACVCAGPVTITGADAVRKSYPGFWDHYQNLGGEIRVL